MRRVPDFWLSVLTDLQSRGVEDILIACVDGLTGFAQAIEALYPQTIVQHCIIHQIRHTLRYVTWTDQTAFMQDLRRVYQAKTREEGERNLGELAEKWRRRYPAAIRSWETNWSELSSFFDFPAQIRRLIYTNNAIEGYHRQLRKVTKNKAVFLTPKSVRKLLYLAHRNIQKKWSAPIPNWAKIRNQLAIRFEGRFCSNQHEWVPAGFRLDPQTLTAADNVLSSYRRRMTERRKPPGQHRRSFQFGTLSAAVRSSPSGC